MKTDKAITNTRVIHPLTGIRGFAAIWVVLYHLRPTFKEAFPNLPIFLNFIDAGYLGVDLFAFLSGFIISYTYCERLQTFSTRAAGRYLWLRFVRTYPLHLFVLALFILMFIKSRGLGSLGVIPYDLTFVRQLFLLNGLGFDDRLAWNVPSWSLSSEWFCYICFPLLAPFIFRVKNGNHALLFAALTLVTTAILLTLVGRPTFDAFLKWPVLRIGGEFLTGCWLYRAHQTRTGDNWLIGWIGLIAISVFTVKSVFYPHRAVVISVAAFAVLIYALSMNRQPLGFLFGNRVSVYLGEISFSIYMIHWFILMNMDVLGLYDLPVMTRGWATLATILVCSAITYELVEKQSQKFLRKLGTGRQVKDKATD